MTLRGFSQTALGTAICRAAHQIVDGEPKILRDPIAAKFLDERTLVALRWGRSRRANSGHGLALFFTRTRRQRGCLGTIMRENLGGIGAAGPAQANAETSHRPERSPRPSAPMPAA